MCKKRVVSGGVVTHVAQKSYTVKFLHEVLLRIFGTARSISKEEAFLKLEAFSNEKKWTKGKKERVMAYLLDRKFCKVLDKKFVITSAKSHAINKCIKHRVVENQKIENVACESKKPSVKKSRKQSLRSVRRNINEEEALILRSIFGEDKNAEFSCHFFQKWVFDLMCAEWHHTKACICKGNKQPTQNKATNLVKKMIRANLVSEISKDAKSYVGLTWKGAVYCGLEEVGEATLNRATKDEKFSRQYSILSDVGISVNVGGLRYLKKEVKRVQSGCFA
ncbi:MAG: hypothetical protein PHP62_04380 [Candidatus Moranbacteria bacterium]|nr:hypothetical protein [Candidatus Moranbacteria bacterium]